MYDAIFIMGCTLKEQRYRNRIDFFRKYGLLNLRDYKIKLILLVGDEDPDEFRNGFSYEVEVVSSQYNHIAVKSLDFYYNLPDKNISEARWWIQVDDDSLTNVGKLLERLDRDFDWRKEYYLVSYLRRSNSANFGKRIVEHLTRHFNEPEARTYFEYEVAIRSQKALTMMLANEKSRAYLKRAIIEEEYRPIYSDTDMGVCAYFSNIKPQVVKYLTHGNMRQDFLQEKVYHIHFIFGYRISPEKEMLHIKLLDNFFKKYRLDDRLSLKI